MNHAQCIFVLFFILFSPGTTLALSLEEGLKIIAETGRDVRIAQADEEAAQAAVGLARSPWLPSVDLYGRETWLRYQPEAKTPFGAMPTSQDQFTTYGIRATQMLYDFGRTSSSISAARYNLAAREIQTSRARNLSALDFIIAYLDLLESEKLLAVAQEEVNRYEAHLKDTAARFNAGVVTKIDVLQADVLIADSRQRFLTAENLRSLRASKLNSLLVRPLNDPVTVEEAAASPASGVSLEEAWAVAEQTNIDLRDMDARIAAKEKTVQSLRAEFLPTLSVSGGYEYLENRYMAHQDNWSVIAGVNWNLFAGGASASRVGAASSELRSLKLAREKMLDAVRLAVKSAHLDLQSSIKKMDVTKSAAAQAGENVRLQRLRYREGVGTSTEVLDAVALMTAAESNSCKAVYGVKRAEAQLLYSMGKDLASSYGK